MRIRIRLRTIFPMGNKTCRRKFRLSRACAGGKGNITQRLKGTTHTFYGKRQEIKTVKKIVLVAFMLLLGSCGQIDRSLAHLKGAQEICFKGVEYVQFASGASVEYGPNGHIVLCK